MIESNDADRIVRAPDGTGFIAWQVAWHEGGPESYLVNRLVTGHPHAEHIVASCTNEVAQAAAMRLLTCAATTPGSK